jgi:hypothetical protein
MCRSHYIDWFIKELGIDNSLDTGFLNCTGVLTNNIILLRALPMFNEISCLNHFLYVCYQRCEWYKTSFTVTVTVVTRRMVWIMWILKSSKNLLVDIHSRFLSLCNSIKTTTIPHSKLKDYWKSFANVDIYTKCTLVRKWQIMIFLKKSNKLKKNLILPKRPLSFWLTTLTYSLCFVDCFSTNSRYSYGYQLCSSFRLLVPLFV